MAIKLHCLLVMTERMEERNFFFLPQFVCLFIDLFIDYFTSRIKPL